MFRRLVILGIAFAGAVVSSTEASGSILIGDIGENAALLARSASDGQSPSPSDERLEDVNHSDAAMNGASFGAASGGAAGPPALACHAQLPAPPLVIRFHNEVKLLFANPPPLGLLKPPRAS